MKINLENKVEIDSQTISRVNQNGTVVVMSLTEDDFFYKIDGVAAEIWQQFSNKEKKLSDIITEIANEYSVSEVQVQKDIEDFLEKVIKLKLIKLIS